MFQTEKSDYMRNLRVLITGPLPPPFGGVSLHISRMVRLLEDNVFIDLVDESKPVKAEFFNIRSLNFYRYFRKLRKTDIFFIHSGVTALRYFHVMAGLIMSKKIILTLHSYPKRKNSVPRFLDNFFFRLANRIIIVNSDILSRLSLPKDKCILRPAFIPPDMDHEPVLPGEITGWISARKGEGKIIACLNASQLKTFNNEDLYGVDLCIDLARNLRSEELNVSFICTVSSIEENPELFERYSTLIRTYDLTTDFLLLNRKISFVRLIEKTDMVLRPTNTDGDALTVREALYLGKPVIASDVVKRPEGTILFKTRDLNDLKHKIVQVLKMMAGRKPDFKKEEHFNYRKFYEELLWGTLKK